ncbi:unnamed protein product [Durusdinium trenchii]|uniref:Uncharacterized protein n=1 Tax=Durusdinium trenchii TaxID=1381693 RepID=A0ABP0KRT3_9DINO
MMIILGSSSVAQAASETGDTNETYNMYVFMLFTALAFFGASQAFMNMLKALVNVIGKVMNDEKSQNLMDMESEESHEVETTESSAQTTEQLQKLVPTRLREENERLKNEVKEHIEANAMLQHRINYLEAEVHRQDDRMDEYEVGLREATTEARLANASYQRTVQALQSLQGQHHVLQQEHRRIQNCRETSIPKEVFMTTRGTKFHVDPQCPAFHNAYGQTAIESCKICEKQIEKDRW